MKSGPIKTLPLTGRCSYCNEETSEGRQWIEGFEDKEDDIHMEGHWAYWHEKCTILLDLDTSQSFARQLSNKDTANRLSKMFFEKASKKIDEMKQL